MPISESKSIDDIMAGVRERAQARVRNTPEPIAQRATARPQTGPQLQSLDPFRQQVATVNFYRNAIGTINPRNPGIHNEMAQLLKQVLRRLLTWYTRPLRLLHEAVWNSLNEAGRLIGNLQRSQVELQRSQVELHRQLSQLSSDVAGDLTMLKAETEQLRNIVAQLKTFHSVSGSGTEADR